MTRDETLHPEAERPTAPARQRIAKLMARVGLCSRRDAEAWIVEGRVSVNGAILTSPATDVGPQDIVVVDGVPLPAAEKTRLFMFHKPRGLVTSDHDPEGRATVADHLHEHWPDGPRVVTIGRLDINTEGLLLLTNDGGLARLLELPKTGWVRRYRVRAKGETDQGVLDRLRDGITIDGVDYAGIEATHDRSQGANVWLTMGLREGKNREIKRVLEHLGLEVNRLIRLSFGPFQLAELAEGAVEEVRTRVLRDQLGPTLAAAAGVDFGDAPQPVERAPAPRRPETCKPAAAPRGPTVRESGARDQRGGERRAMRSPRPPSDAPAPLRERPTAGPRKHVSTLRAAEADTALRGPRRRIERTDTKDRKDRTIKVERLVDARPAPLEPTRTRGAPRGAVRGTPRDAVRPARDGGEARGGSPGARHASPSAARHASPSAARHGSPSAARHASPSAMAKRVRSARSNVEPRGEPRERRDRERESPKVGGAMRERRDASGDARPSRGRTYSPDRTRSAPGAAERPSRGPRPGSRDRTDQSERPRFDRGGGGRDGRRETAPDGRASEGRSKPRRPQGTDRASIAPAKERPARGARPAARGATTDDRRADRPAGKGPRTPAPKRSATSPSRAERKARPPAGEGRRGPERTSTPGRAPRPGGDKRPPRGPTRGPTGGPPRGKPAPRPKR